MRSVAFLDRDGTINEEVDYLASPDGLILIPGSGEAIRLLNEAGLDVIVVTNQSGVARGFFTLGDVDRIHRELDRRLSADGARIDAYYVCPHHPEFTDRCACRKPLPGLFRRAMRERRLNPVGSVAIGDRCADLEPCRALGLPTILVKTGYGLEEAMRLTDPESSPVDRVCPDLRDAVRWFLRNRESGTPSSG
jgi:D-glycero-D-manno-heptose 1,7-bisphosphate phosphatase